MDIDSILLDAEDRMEKAIGAQDRDFSKLRTGRASTALVDGIKADDTELIGGVHGLQ